VSSLLLRALQFVQFLTPFGLCTFAQLMQAMCLPLEALLRLCFQVLAFPLETTLQCGVRAQRLLGEQLIGALHNHRLTGHRLHVLEQLVLVCTWHECVTFCWVKAGRVRVREGVYQSEMSD
jgi:hypothetical protein